MARNINYWQQIILTKIQSSSDLSALEVLTDDEKANLSNLTNTSRVSLWRLFVWIVAFAVYTLDLIFDVLKQEIIQLVKENRPHTTDWYETAARLFQYGDILNDNDEYDVVDVNKQIVKQVAVIKGDRKVTIKIATLEGDELVKINDNDQVIAFTAYMEDNVDAGSDLVVINQDADLLKLTIDYYYNPLLMTAEGIIISTGLNGVKTSIKSYLKSTDFNGMFDINNLTDYLQRTTGYKSLKINYVGFKAGLATSYTPIDRSYNPLSGYMKLDDTELTVNYYAAI